MTNNINKFGVINFYENNSNKQTDNKQKQQIEDIIPVADNKPAQKEYCIYINREKLLEQGIYTIDEFERMFANATKGTAPELAAFLKRYKAQGILNFMRHSKRQIYDNLRAHYPEMRNYDYPNFAAAY